MLKTTPAPEAEPKSPERKTPISIVVSNAAVACEVVGTATFTGLMELPSAVSNNANRAGSELM
jgi:hypothetical protein